MCYLGTTPGKPSNDNGGGDTTSRETPGHPRRRDLGAGGQSKRIPGPPAPPAGPGPGDGPGGIPRAGGGPDPDPLQGQCPHPAALRWGRGKGALCLPGTGGRGGWLCTRVGPRGGQGIAQTVPGQLRHPPAPPRLPPLPPGIGAAPAGAHGEINFFLFFFFLSPSSSSPAWEPQAGEELLPASPATLGMSRQPSDQAILPPPRPSPAPPSLPQCLPV